MKLKAIEFVAIVLTALALVPTGAHFFELPNKIGLPQERYFVVQQIYRGWSLFGVVLVAAIIMNFVLTILLRNRRPAFWFSLVGFVLVAATLAVFFLWTYPANQATKNWTVAPGNWRDLRLIWEYSHATNAILTFLALCSVTTGALKS